MKVYAVSGFIGCDLKQAIQPLIERFTIISEQTNPLDTKALIEQAFKQSKKNIIVIGHEILLHAELRALFDVTTFIEMDDDSCLIGYLRKTSELRVEDAFQHYFTKIKPINQQLKELPFASFSNYILPSVTFSPAALSAIFSTGSVVTNSIFNKNSAPQNPEDVPSVSTPLI